MTNEEAIERFSVAVTATLNIGEQDLYRTAIKALKKQIPKKPANINYIERPYGVVDTMPFAGACVCGKFVTAHSDYCQHCGQRLDWSE